MRLRKGSGPLRASSRNDSKSISSDLAWLMTALHRPRGQALLVVAEFGRDHLDQPARVGVVVDGEGTAVPEAIGVGAQDAQAGRVEGRDPHFVGRRADQLGHAAAHLVGRLVGEGDGQDAPGRGVARRHEVGDAPGQHPRLARAGAGHDQQRSAPVLHRRPLGQGQIVDQGGGIAGEGALLGGRALPPAASVVRPSTATAPSSRTARRLRRRPRRLDLGRGRGRPEALVGGVEELLGPATARPRGRGCAHSHSMVPGGFDVTSRATRFTPSTSLMMREAMRSTRS